MPLTWTIAIAENISGYGPNASAGFSLLHNEIDDLGQIGCLATFRHGSDGLLDEIDITIRKGY
jgi:hypothetical protein